jgi:hypothetical protein
MRFKQGKSANLSLTQRCLLGALILGGTLCSQLPLSTVAEAQSFPKKKVVTSGKSNCALHKNKWQPVKKKGKSFVLDTKAKKADKVACKSLLVPSKSTSLDDLPSVNALGRSNTSAKAVLASLAVSGTPPLLSEISSLGAQNVFWRPSIVSDVATGNPPSANSCQEFDGGGDGESSAFFGCYMAQGVAETFSNILSGAGSLCYMRNMPSQANLDSGGVQVVAGSLPSGGITKVFETPSGSAARLVKVALGAEDIFIRVASAKTNESKGNQYGVDLFFCQGGSVQGGESTVITLGGSFKSESFNTMPSQNGGAAGKGHTSVAAPLIKTSAGLAFDPNAERTASYTSINGSWIFASQVTIGGDNIIKNKFRSSQNGTSNKIYTESKFQGSTITTAQFLEGASKGSLTNPMFGSQTFSGAAEYRNTFYASAPSSAFAQSVNAFNLDADPFFTGTPTVPDAPLFDCGSTADVTLAMNFSAPSMQQLAQTCEALNIRNPQFCQSQTVIAAQARFPTVCGGGGQP